MTKTHLYSGFLNLSVFSIVILSLAVMVLVILLWEFYVPSQKTKTGINFLDGRDPSKLAAPSTTLQSIKQNIVKQPDYLTTITGTDNNNGYLKSQLKQLCSINNLPAFDNSPDNYLLQNCAPGLCCVAGIINEGPICLSDIGQQCSMLSDCVPTATGCINNICVNQSQDNLLDIECKYDYDCRLDNLEDQKNNHVCVNNTCKYNLFPFDMGCQVTEDCGTKIGHQIACKKFTYDQLLFQGVYYSNNSVTLDDNSLMNIGYFNNERYLVRLKNADNNITDISNNYNFIISGISGTNKLLLERVEFSNNNYDELQDGMSVKLHFGNMPSDLNKEIGICMDLLPAGAPSNYSIAGISGVSPIVRDIQPQMTVIDNRYAVEGRKGDLLDFCLQGAPELNCGNITIFGASRDLSCGYNYLYEEVMMDNIFYGLSPRQFNMPPVGSCMLKINDYKEPCDMQLNGCKDPYLCLPVLNPENNTKENYCLTPFRAQICETGLVCPEGYECSTTSDADGENLPYCLSSFGNIALRSGDCISGYIYGDEIAVGIYLYIYNIDKQKYIRLFPLDGIASKTFLTSISNQVNIKISKDYLVITEDSDILSVEKGIKLPKHILIYTNVPTDNYNQVFIYSLTDIDTNAKYNLTNNFILNYNSIKDTSSVYDLELDQDDNVVVIMKNKLESLREFAIKLDPTYRAPNNAEGNSPNIIQENVNGETHLIINGLLPTPTIETSGTTPHQNFFFNIGMLQDGETYDCYLYTPEIDKQQGFNQICKIIYNNHNDIDKFTIIEYPDAIQVYWEQSEHFPGEAYIFFNTNKFQFPSYTNTNSYGAGDYHISYSVGSSFFNLNELAHADYIGEDWIINPIVYRNKGTINNKELSDKYTILEDGDRIKLLSDSLYISSVKNFIVPPSGENPLTEVQFNTNKYLYVENVQQNYDVFRENINHNNQNGTSTYHRFYNNYIINLHDNFYSSEGSAPLFNTTKGTEKFISQNIGSNSNSSTNFEVYGDMVNYSFNFIPVDISIAISIDDFDEQLRNIYLQKPPSFIILNSNDENTIRSPNVNGINKSITYNFEEGTSPKFNFSKNGDERSVLIQNTLQGVSSYSTYVQKIKYNHIMDNSTQVNRLNDFLSTDGYDHLFQNTYSYVSTNGTSTYHQDQIKFSYTDEIIAPNPKSLYFDSSINANLIDNVEENLFNPSNKFSIQTTFNHGSFIKKQGANNQGDDLGINTGNNNYSNKDPPVASYSSYNKFNYDTTVTDSIQYNYSGYDFLNQEKYSYIEVGTSIGPSYRYSGDCVGVQIDPGVLNKITFRTPEIIDLILNNPSSEIVIQKQGPTFKEFYITGGTSTVFSYYDSQATDNTKIPNITNENNLLFDTNSTEQEFNKRIELTRSIIAIEEYDVNLDTEYLVVKINAPIDIRDEYQESILNDISKWRFWIHNFCPLTYTLYGNSYLEYNDINGIENLKLYGDINNEVLTIMDSSCLWGSCKNIDVESFPANYSRTSYNKIAFNEVDGNDSYFNLYQLHDDYFTAKRSDQINNPFSVSVGPSIPYQRDNYDQSSINIYNYVAQSDNINSSGRKSVVNAPSILDAGGRNAYFRNGWTRFLGYSGQLVLSDENIELGPHTGKYKLYNNPFINQGAIESYSGDIIETFFDIENFYPVLDIFAQNYLPSMRHPDGSDNLFVVSSFWGDYVTFSLSNEPGLKNKLFNEYPDYNNWYSLNTANSPTANIILEGTLYTDGTIQQTTTMLIRGAYNNEGNDDAMNIGTLQGRYTIFNDQYNKKVRSNLVYSNKFLPKKIKIFNTGTFNTFKSNIYNSISVNSVEIFHNSYFVSTYIVKPFIDGVNQDGGYIVNQNAPNQNINQIGAFTLRRSGSFPYPYMYNSDYFDFKSTFSGIKTRFTEVTPDNTAEPPISIIDDIYTRHGAEASLTEINTKYTATQGVSGYMKDYGMPVRAKLTKALKPDDDFGPDQKYLNENFIYFKRNYLTPDRDKKIGEFKFYIDPNTSNQKYLNIFGNNKNSVNRISAERRDHPVNFNCRTSYNSFFIFENNHSEDNDGSTTPTPIEEIEIDSKWFEPSGNYMPNNILFPGNTIKYHHLKNKADIYICTNKSYISIISEDGSSLHLIDIREIEEVLPNNASLITYLIPLAEFDIRPANSGTISLLDKYKNYSSKLYMVNNLFLSTLPKNISNFRYNGLNIINDYVVSNLFKTNDNNGSNIVTHYKGKGLVKTPINGSVVFSHYFDKINQFNLINYKEIRFPSFFTERFISRFNSIPYIVNIFTSIREGNIFDNFNYYAFINYKAHDSVNDNYQIVYLSTDVTLETTLENRGIPFAKSVSTGESIKVNIDDNTDGNKNDISKIAVFEPVNKFLFILGHKCS